MRSAQRIHSLEHMFQMTAVAPQTHLKPTFLKDHVYENGPQSTAELKVAIIQKIRAIRKEECVKVIMLMGSIYYFDTRPKLDFAV